MKFVVRALGCGFALGLLAAGRLAAHEETLRTADLKLADALRTTDGAVPANVGVVRLRLEEGDSPRALDGLVRVTPLSDGATPLALAGLFERPAGWFAMTSPAELKLPPGRYRVEATRGTDTLVASATIDCAANGTQDCLLQLQRFYRPEERQLHSGNTHLHLLLHSGPKVGVDLHDRRETDDYLRTVGASDALDLVYVSYLTAPGAQIISNEYTDDDLRRLSTGPTQFVNGVEHRHGGVRSKIAPVTVEGSVKQTKAYPLDSSIVSMTYGHVLLLDLAKRSMLASVGPGLADNPV